MCQLKLFFRKISPGNEGSNRNVIILHGLFGSHKNWLSIGSALQTTGDVFLLDARNHGHSPHSASHTLEDMAMDLASLIQEEEIENPVILGHSMGGLTAMFYALVHAEVNHDLVVVDILPKDYTFRYENEVRALQMDLTGFTSRQEIDMAISSLVIDPFIRQFLLMNLERADSGSYRWKINASAVSKKDSFFSLWQNESKPQGRALFVLGEISEYNEPESDRVIHKYFPEAEITIIPGGNHYLHYTKSQEFLRVVNQFLLHPSI